MPQLTIERVMLIILFALLFALATFVPIDTDTWWHIRSGEHTLNKGVIYSDPFSFTKAGAAWTNHSWGAQILLYLVWKAAGNLGLALYTSVLATAGMAVIYRMCEGSVYLRAFALVLGAATAAVFWSPRPQMLSFFFSAIILYLLFLYKRRQQDRLWLIPVVMLVWGNAHAGFSIGFIFLGAYIAGEILGNVFNRGGEHVIPLVGVRKLVMVAVVSAAVLVINPYGLEMLKVPFQTISIGALREFIQEWNSPNFHERQTWPFIGLLLGILGFVGASSKKLDWTDFILVSGTAFMGLLAGRNIAVFAAAATPVLTYHADALLNERGWAIRPMRRMTQRMVRLNWLLVVVISLGALAKVLLVVDAETVALAQERYLPVRVVAFLHEQRPPGPMFNSYNWGGYLMFALPEYPVFVDGRTDLYGDEFLLNYVRTVSGGSIWRDTLAQYDVNLVVVEAGSGLANHLAHEDGWQQIYPPPESDDTMAVVFVRKETR